MTIQGLETRTCEIRSTKEGIVEGYITKWDTIDSYNSTFLRGSFKQTFKKRVPKKVRLLWNHDSNKLIGRVVEAREDDIGAWVKTKINLDTEAGRTAFSHIQHGDIDSFSFGFISLRDKYDKNGLRKFERVELHEVSPVIFEANEQANITNIRSLSDIWVEKSQNACETLAEIWREIVL